MKTQKMSNILTPISDELVVLRVSLLDAKVVNIQAWITG